MKQVLLLCFTATITQIAFSQNWLTSGNSSLSNSNFIGTTDNKPLIFKTKSFEGGRLQANATWRFGHSSNNVTIDSTGKFSFNGTGAYLVSDNRYIFQYSGNTTKGLYFNSVQNQYQFLNAASTPLFFVHTDNGNSGVLGNFKIGAYTLPATDGTNGQVLTTNGGGTVNWTTLAGGANTSLSNLTTTSINQSLIPASDSAFDIGNKLKAWRNLFVDGKVGIDVDPVAKLDIRAIGASGSTHSLRITNLLPLGLINTVFSVRDDGRVGIGVLNPSASLDVIGDAIFTTTNTDCDLRQKTSVTDMGWFASGSANAMRLYNYAASKSLVTVLGNGNMGINTTTPDYTLDVCGTARAKEVIVETGWCDYVFEKNYPLKSIEEVADFVTKNKHLPNIPSASEVETKGLKVANMNARMMEKIEELTLYIIQQNEKIKLQSQQMEILQNKVDGLLNAKSIDQNSNH